MNIGESEMIIFMLGIIAGGASYLVTQLWMNPILLYLEIRHQITSDLVFYANVINAVGLNDEMQSRHRERLEKNRKHAAEIRAISYRLPFWYKWCLRLRNECPVSASKALIGLSNSDEYNSANAFVERLRISLGIPESIES